MIFQRDHFTESFREIEEKLFAKAGGNFPFSELSSRISKEFKIVIRSRKEKYSSFGLPVLMPLFTRFN